MRPLTIYKASAGSGKTFTLAVEYIKLLIKNPLGFKNILAVTFTNKATEEMKTRILSQLYGIWKMLPESETYMKVVTQDLGISREKASAQAGIALSYLVHNYNYFKVETIDSFFQSILRNLARELNLTANLRVSLNDTEVEEQAVDQIIDSVSSNKVILKWLISYIFSNIDDNKSWNVIEQVKDFGKNIFQDFYKTTGDELNKRLSDKTFFDNYTKQLRQIKQDASKRMVEFSDRFDAEVNKAGLSSDSFSGKAKGISSYFNKLRTNDFSDARCINKTLTDHLSNAESWSSKSNKDRELVLSLVNDRLMSLLHEAEDERKKQWVLYSTADITLRHLDKLRLLNSIEVTVRELNDEANRFLLSDTQHLLSMLIKDSDSSFIFEKVGCLLEHIMIDEFQDTGRIQWQNFKVLLKECMSHGLETDDQTIKNLIVGDVKQSIYRWRSGDWRLLNNIEEHFDYPDRNMEIRTLATNYRSKKNIITFNNAFFSLAARHEYENELEVNTEDTAKELLTAYSDAIQSFKDGSMDDGLVRITLLTNEDYEETTLTYVENYIDELLKAGVQQSEIAILIRYNKHIPLIAEYFMERRPELRIVSDEAFRLDASLAVNTIIKALHLLTHPNDTLSKAELTIIYQKRILRRDIPDNDIVTLSTRNKKQLDSFLPESFIASTNELLRMPLIDIIEKIFSMFELQRLEEQTAYICAFLDCVSEFVCNMSGSIDKFIHEWQTSIHKKTIQSDEIDGIRLISIHKSKGLEFDNVIIPFCDWALESKNTTLWCRPKVEPFSQLPLVPVDYSKKILETIYADDYRKEHIQNRVDNLNLLYVAFTRASRNLFVLGKKNGKGANNRSEILCSCLPDINTELKGSLNGDFNDEEPMVFEYGNMSFDNEIKPEKVSENVFLHATKPYNVKIETSSTSVEFRQSNKSRDFIKNTHDDDNEQERFIKAGNILHKVFSMIRTTSDIDRVLRQMEFDGILYDDYVTADKIRDMLSERLSDKRVSNWFDSRWQVFNERGVLYIDEQSGKVMERRPDRVIYDGNEMIVIDFKFGKRRDEYTEQVRQYMSLLKSMGYDNIRGYLWFVYPNIIEEVKL